MARRLFEDSQGRILPQDLAQMTIEQVIVIWADKEHLGGTVRMDSAEAARRGLIKRTGKSAARLLREKLKAEQEAQRNPQDAGKQVSSDKSQSDKSRSRARRRKLR